MPEAKGLCGRVGTNKQEVDMSKKIAKSVSRKISPETIRLEKELEESLRKLNQLYGETPDHGIPPYARKSLEPLLGAKELKEIEKKIAEGIKSQIYLKTLLRDEEVKVRGEDYNKLVAKAKHHQPSNPFRRTLNGALLKLIKLDRSILRERWVIEKILLEDKFENEDFLKKLADIISKPSSRSDGRVNNKLFNFVKDTVKQNQDITFGEVCSMVSSSIDDNYVDADLRKLCRGWGFKFAPAKKGRKSRV